MACAPESSAAMAHSQTGRRRRPIAAPGFPPGPAWGPRQVSARPPLVRPGPATGRGPRSSLARPPGASQRLRPAEWPALLAAGAAEGRREAGSARISINSGPRCSPPPAPSSPPAPRPSSKLTPEGPRASKPLRRGQPRCGRGAGSCVPGGPLDTPIHHRRAPACTRRAAEPDPWG